MKGTDFKNRFAHIKCSIDAYNNRVELNKSKKPPSVYAGVFFVLITIALVSFYYLKSKVFVSYKINMLIYRLPVIAYFAAALIYAGNSKRMALSQIIPMRTFWLRPRICSVLYPTLEYFKKAPEDIRKIMRRIYPDCEVHYLGCLGNEVMKLYEVDCYMKKESFFTGIAIFANKRVLTEENIRKVTDRYLEIGGTTNWKEYEDYAVVLLPGASMDNMFTDITSCIEAGPMELSFELINDIVRTVGESSNTFVN